MPSPEEQVQDEVEGTILVDRILAELELLARNVDILERLSDNHPMGIIRLSEALKLPIHKVRYSLHLLERQAVIEPSAEGAVVTEKSKEFWRDLDRSLDQMNSIIQHLKDRAASFRAKNAPPPAVAPRAVAAGAGRSRER